MSSLTSTFDECRKQPDGETLEQMRLHYFTDAIMNEKESPNTGGLNIPHAGVIDAIKDRKKREKYAKDMAFALKLLNDRLDALEDKLIDKYGEYFAENLAAEYLDDETYKQLMLIDDQDERRKEIAKAVNKGLDNGSIDPNTINENSDLMEWLVVSKEEQYLIDAEQNAYNSEIDNSISSEQKVENIHDTEQKENLESGFDSLFASKPSIGA